MNGGRGGPRERNTREEERSLAIAVWSTQLYGQWASRQPPSGPRADELGAAHRPVRGWLGYSWPENDYCLLWWKDLKANSKFLSN